MAARTLAISERQREALKNLQDLCTDGILWGMLKQRPGHRRLSEERFVEFIRIMQDELPEVFGRFGRHPSEHLSSMSSSFVLTTNVHAGDPDGYTVRRKNLEARFSELQREGFIDLSKHGKGFEVLAELFQRHVEPAPAAAHA